MAVRVAYDDGYGFPEDKKEAAKWYRKAAEQGLALAQTNPGVCYDNGDGVPDDDEEAFKWWKKAAEQGDAVDRVIELPKLCHLIR